MIRSVNSPSIESVENRTTHKKLISSWAKQSNQEWEIDQDRLRDVRSLREEQMEQPVGVEPQHLVHINPQERTAQWTKYLSIVQAIPVADQSCQTLPPQFENVDREVAVEDNAENVLKKDDLCHHCVTLSKQQVMWSQTERIKSGNLGIKDGNQYGEALKMNLLNLLGNVESCLKQSRLALNKARQETICSLQSNIKDQASKLQQALFQVVREAVQKWQEVQSAQIAQKQLSINGDIAELQTRMDDQIEQIFGMLRSIERRKQISAERRLHFGEQNQMDCAELASGSKYFQNSRLLCEMSEQIMERIQYRKKEAVDTYKSTGVVQKSGMELRFCLENILFLKAKTAGGIKKTEKPGINMGTK